MAQVIRKLGAERGIALGTAHMLTGELRSQIDAIWNSFWSGGISNPLEVMEQITYLLFLRRLDDLHTLEENKSVRLGKPIIKQICETKVIQPPFPLQQSFASRVQSVEKLKATHRAALQELDRLFASLQHRAFQGEL